ncbi:hypothetical protein TWF970_005237 [Orbilia oligospora]|uniref:Uncharacterized protein n=1 Tax=Orbilia oligospora TaxID=2813651 RepID=A0A7C8R6X2_ORBOL|nr:hypothetical protein TWF970_005237 [Orbilia oligospora]
MLLLNSPRREQAYINAATRAFDKASIDDLTTDFIAAFNITGRDIHDLLGSETYPETTWQILPGDAAPVIWPLERLTSTNEKVEDFCRIVNAALETSGLSISASFAAMLYVTLLSDDSGLKSAVDNSLEVLDYKGVSDARLGELGVTLNKAGITVDSALSHCGASKKMHLNFQSYGKSCLSGSSGLCQRLRRDAAEHPLISRVAGLVEPLVRRGSSIHNLSVNDIPASSLEDDAILAFNPVYDVVQKRELQNSEIIRFKTDNPDTHPLPHPHLLWLHANISRVVRMAGRTGEYEYASEFDPELEEEEL